VQHVTESTHKRGHILDLVITTAATDISKVCVGGMLSDHALIHFTVSVKTLRVDEQWLTCRKWRLLSREAFASDLAAAKLCADNDMDVLRDQSVDDLVQLYRDVHTRLLDQHCPFITVRRRRKKTTPWFDADCRDARRRARAAERRFRR